LDLRLPTAGGRAARFHGTGGVIGRQHDDGVLLVEHAAGTTRPQALGSPRPNSPRPSSSGSRRSTTRSVDTHPSVISARSSSKPFTAPQKLRHDRNNQPVRRNGSGSSAPIGTPRHVLRAEQATSSLRELLEGALGPCAQTIPIRGR
jgi:hypothetical protein